MFVSPTLSGGTLLLNGGGNENFPAFGIKGTVTVIGTTPSNINIGTGGNNTINIGPTDPGGFLTFNVADVTGDAASDLNANAPMKNSRVMSTDYVSGLIKTGNGTMTLSAANTYNGTTTINGGVLALNHASALGGGGNVTFTGGTLQHSANNTVTYGARIKNSTSAIQIDTNGQSVTYSGAIDSSNTGGLTKLGLNALLLSAANTFTGTTTINDGTLQLNNANALGGGGNITFTGSTGGILRHTASNTEDYGARIKNSTGAIRINTFSQTVTYSGAIDSSNTGGLTKTNTAGTLTLANDNNTYTGVTTVFAGTLALSTTGTNNIANSSRIVVEGNGTLDVSLVAGGFTLADGQTLSGTGSIVGDMVLGNGSFLSPGNSPGILAVTGNNTWAGGATYLWEMNDATGAAGNATAGWDLETVTGLVDITATSGTPFIIDIVGLDAGNAEGVVPNFNNTGNYSWLIADAGSTITSFDPTQFSLLTGNFTNNNSLGGGSFAIVRGENVGGGNDTQIYLTFTAVPEPSTLALAAVGIAGLACIARRMRKR
jgi:autotransporter-associated beta strand protein